MASNNQNTSNNSGNTKTTQPAKKRKKKQYKINGLSYVLFILGISFILSAFLLLTANDVFALTKPEHTKIVQMESDVSAKEMAKILQSNNIIEYPWAFKLYASLKDKDTFKQGKYELDTAMDYGQIIDSLSRVPTYRETLSVTIPEGYTLDQIATLLEDSMVCSKEDILKVAAEYKYKHEFLQDVPYTKNRLEGFLFPDTYQFYKNDKPVNVLNKMLNNFDTKYTKEIEKMAEQKKMTMTEVLTIASMIEREAVMESEQSKISGVISNRLKNSSSFPFLQIDATVQYAIGEHKVFLTAEDLKVQSPYNTYVQKGLPPGPICNPGVNAIVAALNPESHKFYYYVATGEEDGSHIFSKTIEEHNAARAKVAAGKNK